MTLLDTLPGATLGFGPWLGLRPPWAAVKIAALLAVVVALALGIVAPLPGDPAGVVLVQGASGWSAIPATLTFLTAPGFGRLLRGRAGGGVE